MGFGLFYLPDTRQRESVTVTYEAILTEIRCADTWGWNTVWLSEHHFHDYGGAIPSPAVLGAVIAAQTNQIRIGAGVALLPMRDCLRLAEEFSMLDVLSRGRVEMGIGLGFMPHEFSSLSISLDSREKRFHEGLEVLRLAWSSPTFSYTGEYYNLSDVSLFPRPLQQPHPPIWVAAARNPATFKLAGHFGFNLMLNPYTRTMDELKMGLDWYREALELAGFDSSTRRILVHHHLYVAPTQEQARQEPEEALMSYLQTADLAVTKANPHKSNGSPALTYDFMYPDRVMFGTPEVVAEKVHFWQQFGATDFCFMTQFGCFPLELSLRSLQLFSEEVMPQFT